MNDIRRSGRIVLLPAIGFMLAMLVPLAAARGGFDEYGYNYQAHLFNGDYDLYNRNQNELTPGYEVHLTMKWNDAWLSNKDRDGDGNLDRHWGYPSYIGSNAWLTNHMVAVDDATGKVLWTYFVKIVAPIYQPTDSNGDSLDDASGCPIIWGSFLVIQRVYNEKGGPHGIEFLTQPAGFGAW